MSSEIRRDVSEERTDGEDNKSESEVNGLINASISGMSLSSRPAVSLADGVCVDMILFLYSNAIQISRDRRRN